MPLDDPTSDPFAAIGSAAPLETTAESLKQAEQEAKVLEDPKEKVQKEVHTLAIKALRFGAVLFATLIVVRFWHLAGPPQVFGYTTRWLTDPEIQSIDKMLFSSAFGGLVLGYLKELMAPIKKS